MERPGKREREMAKNQISGRLTNGTKWEGGGRGAWQSQGGGGNCKPCLALHKYFDRAISAYELCMRVCECFHVHQCVRVCVCVQVASAIGKCSNSSKQITKVAAKLRQKCGKMKWSNGPGPGPKKAAAGQQSLSNHIPLHGTEAVNMFPHSLSPSLSLSLSLTLSNWRQIKAAGSG